MKETGQADINLDSYGPNELLPCELEDIPAEEIPKPSCYLPYDSSESCQRGGLSEDCLYCFYLNAGHEKPQNLVFLSQLALSLKKERDDSKAWQEFQTVRSMFDIEKARQIIGATGWKLVPSEKATALHIHTSEAIDYFFKVKTGLKDSTIETNRKRLKAFALTFPELPLDSEMIQEGYMNLYTKHSLRYQRNIYDVLDDLYSTVKTHFKLRLNPMDGIKRPNANGTGNIEPHPLNEKWLPRLISAAETDMEKAALDTELGAGWRPCAYRRIRAIDVREALYRNDPIIYCRDKERNELTPILPESLELLAHMTPSNLKDDAMIILNLRCQPMGHKAHTRLIYGLYRRAGIPDSFVPYDLRDTFATLVDKYSRNYFLTERLLHHKLPGEGKRYDRYPLDQLCKDLQEFSPLRRIKHPLVHGTHGGSGSNGEGGTRTPTHCCTGS